MSEDKKYSKEVEKIIEEMAAMPEEERVEYSTNLLNNLILRSAETNSINIKLISNGEYTFGDFEYNHLVMLSFISQYLKEISFKMKINEELFLLGIKTPEGTYTNILSILLWEGYDIEEREFDEEILTEEKVSLDVLFSLLD